MKIRPNVAEIDVVAIDSESDKLDGTQACLISAYRKYYSSLMNAQQVSEHDDGANVLG